MPSRNLILVICVVACGSAVAETPLVESHQAAPAPVARTFIPDSLEVPVFIPPTPPVVKVFPRIQIDASVTVPAENSTTITIQRGEPSTAPDLPPPAAPAPSPLPPIPTQDELAEQKWQRQHSINLGATVYDHKISQVQWTDQENGKSYQAWCGFDVSLLAGLGGFVHKGEFYQFFLMHSSIETEKSSRDENQDFGNPEISPGQILVTQGIAEDPASTALIRVIQDVIASEKDRLLVHQVAREKYQRESAEWHKAHPPIPRNETFILRPHRGSRYLGDAQPEQKGGTQ